MNILIIDSESRAYIDTLIHEQNHVGGSINLTYVSGVSQIKNEHLEQADAVIVYFGNDLQSHHIKKLSKCKGIVAATAGFNNIDIQTAKNQGIPVCNIPDYGYEDVADHTIALMLGCIRKLPTAQYQIRNNCWNWHTVKGSMRLKGKKFGVIGLGRIGHAVATRAQAFGMDISFYDPYLEQSQHPEFLKIDHLKEFLSVTDVISINCPLTEETKHLINKDTLSFLHPHSIIINTARGAIIEQSALTQALRTNQIGGVGLDVLETEPLIPQELLSMDNVILTPHSAFYTQESLELMRTLAITSAINFLNGDLSLNSIVNGIHEVHYAHTA